MTNSPASPQIDTLKNQSWEFQKDWTVEKAKVVSYSLHIPWTDDLESWLEATRLFFTDYEHAPNTRVLVKHLKKTVDANLSSMSLHITLGGNPALILAFLSGIPKPKQCF